MTDSDARKVSMAFREGLRGLIVAPGQTVACILSLAVAGVLVMTAASVGSLTMAVLDRASSSARMIVYLKDQVDTARVTAMIEGISRRHDVESVSYMSREEDRRANADLLPADLVQTLPLDAIPGQHGLLVKFRDIGTGGDGLSDLTAFLRELEGVDIVAEPPVGAATIKTLAGAVGFVRVTLSMLAVILLGGTLFFVVGTLTHTMERRREEMQILRLVGATNLFLKAPLFIQGIAQGIAGLSSGALAAFLIIHGTNSYLMSELGIGIALPTQGWLALLVSIPGGIIVGMVGAFIATARRLP
ncbi:MAG TPA: hypothetical protein PLZ31_11295 [Myxococcota bacterium]|nr:hypothetical protein [Myxococcota bacterium]